MIQRKASEARTCACAHPLPVLFPSNLHARRTSKIPDLTFSKMKNITLWALIKKWIEVPESQVGIPDILPQIVHPLLAPPFLKTDILKRGKLLRASPVIRINKAINPGNYPTAFTMVSGRTALNTFCIWELLRRQKKIIIST